MNSSLLFHSHCLLFPLSIVPNQKFDLFQRYSFSSLNNRTIIVNKNRRIIKTDIFVTIKRPPAKITDKRIQSHIVHSPISSRLNFAIGSSLEIMASYQSNVVTVMVKNNGDPQLGGSGECLSEIKLDPDTASCFILYPDEPNEPGQVLGCEVSTYKLVDGGEVDLVLQTIADREFTNVCKVIPGYSKTLKVFTASVPCTPRDAGFDVKSDSLTMRLYCRSRCIKDINLWSPSVEYIPTITRWYGGPCQLVCRKGNYGQIQMIYYNGIYEIYPGVYLIETHDVLDIDIMWNTLPIERGIQELDIIIPPVSFVMVPSTNWSKIFPSRKLIDEEYFKSKDKRAMSLATYYLNDATKARNELIEARIQNQELRRLHDLIVNEYRGIADIANSTVQRLYRMFTNLNKRHDSSCESLVGPSRKRSRENSDGELDYQSGDLQIVDITDGQDETCHPEQGGSTSEAVSEHDESAANPEAEVVGEKRSFPSEIYFKEQTKLFRFIDEESNL